MKAIARGARAGEGGLQLRDRGDAVDVVVPENNDPLAAARGGHEPIRGFLDSGEAERVVEVGLVRPEEKIRLRGRGDSAGDQKPRDERRHSCVEREPGDPAIAVADGREGVLRRRHHIHGRSLTRGVGQTMSGTTRGKPPRAAPSPGTSGIASPGAPPTSGRRPRAGAARQPLPRRPRPPPDPRERRREAPE